MRVYASFDHEGDAVLGEFVIEQSQRLDSPFEVIAHSRQTSPPGESRGPSTREAVRECDLVLVLVGQYTHRAPGVLEEVRISLEEDTPLLQISGYRRQRFVPVAQAGPLYQWGWEGLKALIKEMGGR